MGQCESCVFFPDNPAYMPQFNGCPREAATRRRTFRFGDHSNGEPIVLNFVVKLCGVCAREWDQQTWCAEEPADKVSDQCKAVASNVLPFQTNCAR
jgi:hypothetical protein